MSERDTSTPTTDSGEREYVCTNCRRGFNATMAHRIVLLNETEAKLMCSWCKHMDRYQAPAVEEIERPPAIAGRSVRTDENGLTTARLLFEGGAWLQFRETEDGWVYEEMFTADGEKIESFRTEFDREKCVSPTEYLHQEADRYPTYTKEGLRIQRAHIAATLFDVH